MTQYSAGAVPLDQPYYGASFGVAFSRFWKKYATFRGRASRSEFWWWELANALIAFVLTILVVIGAFVGGSVNSDGTTSVGPLFYLFYALLAIYGLATIVPNLAVTARRLHDANFSGWFILLGLVPFGSLVVLVFTVLASNPQGSRFD